MLRSEQIKSSQIYLAEGKQIISTAFLYFGESSFLFILCYFVSSRTISAVNIVLGTVFDVKKIYIFFMNKMQLFLNSLSFRYPSEPVTCYFSTQDDEEKKSDVLKSKTLVPKEVKALSTFEGIGGQLKLYTTYDKKCRDFMPVSVDFNDPDNEDYVKRYYNQKLKRLLSKNENLMFTQSGITRDLQVWEFNPSTPEQTIAYMGRNVKIWTLDRFTIKVRFDAVNNHPYLLIACDRPASILGVPLNKLDDGVIDPFVDHPKVLTASMVNKVMIRKRHSDGKPYDRRIISLQTLHEKNIPYNASDTLPVLNREMKHVLGIDSPTGERDWKSKYVKYLEKITSFKDKYLTCDSEIKELFKGLSTTFTPVGDGQLGQVDASKRMLRFGSRYTNNRPQEGINAGPAINCPNVVVKLIFIFCETDRQSARNLLTYFCQGNYGDEHADESRRKRLSKYMGTNVSYAEKELHIIFKNTQNPVPEVMHAIQQKPYQNLDPRVKYVGIYISPIHKTTSDSISKESYYHIKEAFLKKGIVTQCIDVRKMLDAIDRDRQSQARNFLYSLQNMGVAICAKTGGSPWLLDETTRKELIIGIGAFKTAGEQFIGAAFSFDNTGVLCDYDYFRTSQFRELVGKIELNIRHYTSVNNPPERLIIHYYKKLSMRKEASQIMSMLASLNLDIPVYVVSINKTESEDLVLFDNQSIYSDRKGTHQSLMPMSGTWANLGRVREGYRYLLCNNTRYGDDRFRVTDGFPFPVKLTICCFGCNNADIDTHTVELLIGQVYQFSRIYWRSVRQQGLPVTIKYPEIIAEIMPHFDNPIVYPEKGCLWFL